MDHSSDTLFLILFSLLISILTSLIMALSTGGLAGIILFLILLHVGGLIGYYFYLQKNPNGASKIAVNEKMQEIFR